jgi:hypothetical protein
LRLLRTVDLVFDAGSLKMGSECGGFNFDLCKRNAFLEKKGVPGARAWKTGTTIAGVIYKVWRGREALVHPMHTIEDVLYRMESYWQPIPGPHPATQ